MLVNPDFSRRAVVTAADHRWVVSSQPGTDGVTPYLKTGHPAGLAT